MMKNTMVRRIAGAALATGVLLVGVTAPAAPGDNPVLEIEGMDLDASQDMHVNLHGLEGKRVLLTLRSGKEIPGRIKQVSEHFVLMQGASPKDFTDVLVRIDRISALEVQARGYLRDIERAGLKAKPASE